MTMLEIAIIVLLSSIIFLGFGIIYELFRVMRETNAIIAHIKEINVMK